LFLVSSFSMSADFDHFINLPEPPIRGDDTIRGRVNDRYLDGYEEIAQKRLFSNSPRVFTSIIKT